MSDCPWCSEADKKIQTPLGRTKNAMFRAEDWLNWSNYSVKARLGSCPETTNRVMRHLGVWRNPQRHYNDDLTRCPAYLLTKTADTWASRTSLSTVLDSSAVPTPAAFCCFLFALCVCTFVCFCVCQLCSMLVFQLLSICLPTCWYVCVWWLACHILSLCLAGFVFLLVHLVWCYFDKLKTIIVI